MENKLAKALYDNTSECPDELAFRKGDVVMVLDKSVSGNSGWWMCSLYGRQGLAPANRLQLLPQTVTTVESLCHGTEQLKSNCQNIYQIPVAPRPSTSPAYEFMEKLYKVPSTPLSVSKSPIPSALKHSTDTPEGIKPFAFNVLSGPKEEVYDVPNQARQTSLFTSSTTSRKDRKSSLVPISELERRFDPQENLMCSSPSDIYVYPVPPTLSQEPSYDIPVPSATEAQQIMGGSYRTLPNPRKTEWIYDVPLSPDKPGHVLSGYDRMLSTVLCRPPYAALPTSPWIVKGCSPTRSPYDIPKPSSFTLQTLDNHSPPQGLPKAPIYDTPPAMRISEELVYDVPPQEHSSSQGLGDPHRNHIPLECRGVTGSANEHNRECLQRPRKALAPVPMSYCTQPGIADSLLLGDNKQGGAHICTVDSQRISTASSSSTSSSTTSSTSSCDFLALSSSSLEPLREVTLSQEEACQRLLDLKEAVCSAVPRLMVFVSSCWRSKEHLEKHLKEIRAAADDIACAVTCFLNFALDVKGNASQLTDTNLQSRLYKQLSIVEDSGVILRQTVAALNMAGWPLSSLSQDPGQALTPDQLERFVMVARTVPEDVKHLVSILNANGKLLFREAQKESETHSTTGQTETQRSPEGHEQAGDLLDDDNDYVQLQTKNDFEKQQEESKEKETKDKIAPTSKATQGEQKQHQSQAGIKEQDKSSLSEHCRLYFGALQKAIGGFVCSLRDGQPPEKFISHSKLVIMVGQRLVDTLCREAQRKAGATQSLLCKSNHLCALLKQLAVATKKAALHFPDKQALHEAQDFAKELAQRAQHFRVSLDL